jgi:hypothetical protein
MRNVVQKWSVVASDASNMCGDHYLAFLCDDHWLNVIQQTLLKSAFPLSVRFQACTSKLILQLTDNDDTVAYTLRINRYTTRGEKQ